MNDQTATPEILEAEWNHDQVSNLFSDLSLGAKVHHVQVRSTTDCSHRGGSVTLDDAYAMFDNGEAIAIQIQYKFDDQSWCDTLMIGEPTTKIIRTRQ